MFYVLFNELFMNFVFFLFCSLLFRYRPPDCDYHWLALLLHVCWCAVLQWVLRAPWHYNCVKQFKRRKHKSIPVHLHLAIQKRIYWLTCWAQYNRQVSLVSCFGTYIYIQLLHHIYFLFLCLFFFVTQTNKQINPSHVISPFISQIYFSKLIFVFLSNIHSAVLFVVRLRCNSYFVFLKEQVTSALTF